MKYLLWALTAFLMMVLASPKVGYAVSGEVVYNHYGCDYFIVSTGGGYALLEWYGGNDPDVGDVIAGGYESYGFKDIYNITDDRDLRVWVEDYWLSRARVTEKYQDKCDGRYPSFSATYAYYPPVPARASCSVYGPNASLTRDGTCACVLGYEWNSVKTQCVQSLTCSDGYVKKSNQCLTYSQDCQQTFGGNVFGRKGDPEGSSECFCSSGYVWNSTRTACILGSSTCQSGTTFSIASNTCIPLDQACSDAFGGNSLSNGSKSPAGDANCICKTGFAWSADRTQCIMPSVSSTAELKAVDMDEFCTSSLGQNGIFDKASGNCQCEVGFEKKGGGCRPVDVAFVGVPRTKADIMRCAVVGSKTSKVYYPKGHKSISQMLLFGKVCFINEVAAKKSGYRKIR